MIDPPPTTDPSRGANNFLLTDFDDPRLDDYRFLRDRDLSGARRNEGLFVGETLPIIVQMLAHPGLARSVLTSQRMATRAAKAIAESASATLPLLIADDALLERIAGFDVHRGVLAIGLRVSLDHRTPFDPAFQSAALLIALDGVSNMDNVGAIFRSAAAFGVRAIILSRDSHDPLYRKAVRVSMGYALTIPYAWSDDLASTIVEMRRCRPELRVLAADCSRSAQDIADFDANTRGNTPPTLLIVGSEHEGISPAVLAVSTHRVRIPIATSVDSLNAAVAASICLHRLATKPS